MDDSDNDNAITIQIPKSRFITTTRNHASLIADEICTMLQRAGFPAITQTQHALMRDGIHTTMSFAVLELLASEGYTLADQETETFAIKVPTTSTELEDVIQASAEHAVAELCALSTSVDGQAIPRDAARFMAEVFTRHTYRGLIALMRQREPQH